MEQIITYFPFIAAFLVLVFGFNGAPMFLWTALLASGLWIYEANTTCWIVFGTIALLFNIPPLRAMTLSWVVMKTFDALKILPQISEAELTALNSGDVWIERDLFSGRPDFKNLIDAQVYPKLTAEEQAFLDGPVEKLCNMLDDWKVSLDRDLSPEVWDFIKKQGFLGMIIPKEYGGLGFSALAHAEVLQKVASRSGPAAISVMVPNSLGPAELLNHYGTDAQKKHYLPRLAKGDEIPCFALTEPGAGSDAASIQASGELFKDADGQLKIKLNWNKRWITLAAVATTIGLAFRLRDPNKLVGDKEDLGITCALIPASTPGVVNNKRHDPLGIAFYNCPTQGKDVVVSVDQIIGGIAMAGKGWKMLMESLAAGRGISLPSQATACAKLSARVASAHAVVRKQFGMSIGNFEGIQEALARITGYTYIMDATRYYTMGGLDRGIKPPVITAMAKYYFTEMQRVVLNDAMDIQGGQAISQGPRNLLANAYKAVPISITVEGANILTRTLIIFGQGALRAHPFASKEVQAMEQKDLQAFDRAFWGHVGHVIRNLFRSVIFSWTRGYCIIPHKGGVTGKYYRRLAWASARFALMSDIAMGALGGKLKAKGKVTGRFADALAGMYMASAVLKRFEAEGRRKEDEAIVKWTLQYCFARIQDAFDGLYGAIDIPLVGFILKGPLRWLNGLNSISKMPSDNLDFALAKMVQTPGEFRDRLTSGIFIPKHSKDRHEQLGLLDETFKLSYESEAISRKVFKARKTGQIKKGPIQQMVKDAISVGAITQTEAETLDRTEKMRWETIQVDDFALDEYKTM